jgi:hypothetical protein
VAKCRGGDRLECAEKINLKLTHSSVIFRDANYIDRNPFCIVLICAHKTCMVRVSKAQAKSEVVDFTGQALNLDCFKILCRLKIQNP